MSFSPPETPCCQLPLCCQPTRYHLPHIRKFTSLFRDLRALDERETCAPAALHRATAVEMAGLKLAIGQVFDGVSISKACQSTEVAN